MDADVRLLTHLYERFNARDIDGVLSALSDDVAWANGMDGGHEQGREAVRAYWTRQWAIISPRVEPVRFQRIAEDKVKAEVRQTIRDLAGNPLQGQAHQLVDKMVGHIFQLRDGKVVRFDIEDAG